MDARCAGYVAALQRAEREAVADKECLAALRAAVARQHAQVRPPISRSTVHSSPTLNNAVHASPFLGPCYDIRPKLQQRLCLGILLMRASRRVPICGPAPQKCSRLKGEL